MKVSASFRYGLEILVLAAVYFAAGKLGLKLASVHPSTTAVWPPTGIALAVLLTAGLRMWPGIALGAFLTNVLTFGSVASCLGIAVGNTLEAVAGAYLLKRFARGVHAFDRPQDFFKFVGLAAIASTTISPTIGLISQSLAGYADWREFGRIWLTWWLGDMSGDLTVAPLLLLWRRPSVFEWTWKRRVELAAIFSLILLVGLATFSRSFYSHLGNFPLLFLSVPPLIWVALRFGQREAAVAVVLRGALAIGGTMEGYGPFVRASQNESLLLIQLFMGMNAVIALTLGAVVLQRAQATGALKRSEAQARAMLESALDCIITLDSKGRILEFNPAAERVFGYTREEALGRGMAELIISDGLQAGDREGFEKYFASEEARIIGRRVERMARRADGAEFPVELAFTRVRGEGEQLFTAFLLDITERKKAQKALGDSERRFRSVWEGSADGMRLTDADGIIVAVNGAFCRMAGIGLEEAVGKPFTFCYGEAEKPDEMLARYKKKFGEQRIRMRLETRVVFRSKKMVDLEITNSFIELENEGGLLLGIFRDVTARKRAEVRNLAFSTLAHELSKATGVRDAARTIIETASRLLPWDACFLHLYFPEENRFVPVLTIDTIEDRRVELSLDGYPSDPSPMMRKVVKEGAQLILRKPEASPTEGLIPIGDVERPSASLMFVPIHDGEQVVGILSLQSYLAGAYNTADLETLQALADHGAGALERIRAEEGRLQAEERYRNIFENATEGIFQSTPEGKFLSVNPALASMLGYESPEQLIQQYSDIRNQLYVEGATRDRLIAELAAHGSVQGFENEIYRRDGSRIWVTLNAREVRDASGKLLYYEGSNQDITERKRAEDKVRLLAHTIESISEMASITDLENRLIYVNRAFLDKYGYRSEEILGRSVSLVLSPKNPPGMLDEIAGSTRRGQWQGEVLDQTKDGKEFPIWLSTSHVSDDSGNVIALVGIATDITERKQAELRSAAFSTLAHDLSAAPAARDAARIIVRLAQTLLGWDSCFLHLYSPEEKLFRPVLTIDTIDGKKTDVSLDSYELNPSPSMRRVVREGAQLILRQHPGEDTGDLIPIGDLSRRSASLMFVPIRHGRRVVGILSVQSYRAQAYDREDLQTLQALADHCAGALERMGAQEAMLQAEEKYRTIFENATEGLFQSTPAGRFLNVNPAFASLLGYPSPREFIRSVIDMKSQLCVVPENYEVLQQQLIEKGFVRNFEIQLYRKDRSIRWVNFNARVVREPGGQLLTEGSTQDITERKRAEKLSAAFSKLGERLSAAVTRREAAQLIGDVAQELFGWDAYTVDAYDGERDEIHSILNIDVVDGQVRDVSPATGVTRPTARARRIIEKGGELILRQAPVVFPPDSSPFGDIARPSASLLLVSIRHGERVTGILSIQSYTPQAYTSDDLSALQALADHCGGALERIRAQETLANFAAIVEHSDDAIISMSMEGAITGWNRAAERIFGYSAAEILGRDISILVPPEKLNEETSLLRRIERKDESDHYETVRMRKDGKQIDISVTVSPIKDSSGQVIGASKIARDITERKKAREALREANDRVFSILNSISDGFVAFDGQWRITYYNRAADDLVLGTRRSPRKILGRSVWDEFPQLVGTKLEVEYRRALQEQVPVEFEYFSDTLDRWFDIRAYPSGDGLAIYFRNITERKRAEAEIRNSLHEKEVMLKEINHRVKNNLQVISSLLHLQAQGVKDATARDLLKESENRVKSMSLIHENLYQSQNLSQIDFGEYVKTLTTDLSRSFGVDNRIIQLKVRIPQIFLGVTAAIPCGLIINELVSNALKYAFPKGRKGEIGIDLVANPDTTLSLTIRDDGVGLPAGMDFRKTATLGMQLVVNLVRQMNGTVVLQDGPGTCFKLTFKL